MGTGNPPEVADWRNHVQSRLHQQSTLSTCGLQEKSNSNCQRAKRNLASIQNTTQARTKRKELLRPKLQNEHTKH